MATSKVRPRRLSRWAIQEIKEVCNDQVCTAQVKALSQVAYEDLQIQGLLGEGGFSSVYHVQLKDNKESLALKQLRWHKRGREEEDWVLAVFDLCNEVSMLARIQHEHVISIRGVCQSSVSKAYQTGNGYFFLMEKLNETLSDRLKVWRQAARKPRLGRSHSFTSAPDFHGSSSGLLSSQAMCERLRTVALGVAKGMCHIHSPELEIVVRDLKPQNIGFAADGTVKIFDFGMARPVYETDTADLAGTFRYMSPEVVLGHRLGLEADVYSFGIILYELVTLQKPFDQYFQNGKLVKRTAFFENVVGGSWRPSLSAVPCRATRRLIEKCWNLAPRQRPSFPRVYFLLNQILKQHEQSLVTSSPTAIISPLKEPKRVYGRGGILGAFRALRPLSKLSSRASSDVTVETSSTKEYTNEAVLLTQTTKAT